MSKTDFLNVTISLLKNLLPAKINRKHNHKFCVIYLNFSAYLVLSLILIFSPYVTKAICHAINVSILSKL